MYALLSAGARQRTSRRAFGAALREAALTATTVSLRAGTARRRGDRVRVPMTVATRAFGTVRAPLVLPLGGGDATSVDWRPHLAFPGVRRGERLRRRTQLPRRADLLARDGTPLAAGASRAAADPELGAVAGAVGPIPPARAAELRAQGVPPDAAVGLSGLERALDGRLRGRPGGLLLADSRVLATSASRPAPALRSTIAPVVQRAARAALAGRLGGVVALDPLTGELLAEAGLGLEGLQPPGSTFKIVTLAGALQAGVTRPAERFPVQTSTTIEGVELENANRESCGGTLIASFAHSCNSVFAPLGAELGARRLVSAAEAFGFNAPSGIDGSPPSTLPDAQGIGDDLAVGSTAIGQGRVLATPLQMAVVAATIAADGRRPRPSVAAGARPRAVRAVPPAVAEVVARAMRAVVREGTGTGARLAGVSVAGKTGTAELRDSTRAPAPGEPVPPVLDDPTDTSAWFVAYAPARRPRIAVAVLLVEAGAGGQTAAPAARQVLQAAVG